MTDIDYIMISETQEKFGVDAACRVAKTLLHHSIDDKFASERQLSKWKELNQLSGFNLWFNENRDQIYGIPKELL